jgi:UDP-N-acetylmuramate: L-alanyl-gamma-D-glutamyl-meso-diaminopimelate ligase
MHIHRAHFIGIGGVGMSATAKLLQDMGIAVSGSDENIYPPVSDFLRKERIRYSTPYAAENLPQDCDLIVIGKSANLTPEQNVEVKAAYASGRRIVSFPEVLGELSQGKETIVVAGSYGKSTCTALLAHCLERLIAHDEGSLDLSYFIGAIPNTPATNAQLGIGSLFVLEGDEYPSSNDDPRAKFLHYHPQHLLITPLAHDHLNVFPTPGDYLRPFEELVTLPPAGNPIVACVDGSLSTEFLSKVLRPVVTYGFAEGDFHSANIVWGEKTAFSIVSKGIRIADVTTSQLGEHNIQNIVGVAAFLFSNELIGPFEFETAVAAFRGVKRRLDRKSDRTTIPIYESFGSSYDKARSDIAAIRRHFPTRRLILIFEPHTFSWRNRAALSWYDSVFSGVDKLFVFDPPVHGATTHAQISQRDIIERIRDVGRIDAQPISACEHDMKSIEATMQANDVILLMSSGALGGLVQRIPAIAEKKFPK